MKAKVEHKKIRRASHQPIFDKEQANNTPKEPFIQRMDQSHIAQIRPFISPSHTQPIQAKLLVNGMASEPVQVRRQSMDDTLWNQFAEQFNHEFGSGEKGNILHVFKDNLNDPPPNASKLKSLFTENQRDKLMQFFSTRQIPDRLFTGDDKINTTASQRILLSAHILANGVYQPGSFEQKVHARMCYHWVQLVQHYAGVTTAYHNRGVMGSFDHAGNIVFGSNKNESDFKTFQGRKVFAGRGLLRRIWGKICGEKDLPYIAETGHAEAAEKEREERAIDPAKKLRVHRRHAFPLERFKELKPGDWLWYYNANKSAGGSHSVIFSRWVNPIGDDEFRVYGKKGLINIEAEKKKAPKDRISGVKYKVAELFSTRRLVGHSHKVKLGDRFIRNMVYPITHVSRVSEKARPARTVEEFLTITRRHTSRNKEFLEKVKRRYLRSIDQNKLLDALRKENIEHIKFLSDRLTEKQRELLLEANKSNNLDIVVALTGRLRRLQFYAKVLQRNMQKRYKGDQSQDGLEYLAENAQKRKLLIEIDRKLKGTQEYIKKKKAALAVLRSQMKKNQESIKLATRKNEDSKAQTSQNKTKITQLRLELEQHRKEVASILADIRKSRQLIRANLRERKNLTKWLRQRTLAIKPLNLRHEELQKLQQDELSEIAKKEIAIGGQLEKILEQIRTPKIELLKQHVDNKKRRRRSRKAMKPPNLKHGKLYYEISEVKAEIDKIGNLLRRVQREKRKDFGITMAGIRYLRQQAKLLMSKAKNLHTREWQLEKIMPFGRVHPGRLPKPSKSPGILQNLFKFRSKEEVKTFEQFLISTQDQIKINQRDIKELENENQGLLENEAKNRQHASALRTEMKTLRRSNPKRWRVLRDELRKINIKKGKSKRQRKINQRKIRKIRKETWRLQMRDRNLHRSR